MTSPERKSEELEPIALFPIPGSVSLPYGTVPLHVFEPRYRKLIHDAVELGRRVAVAHTTREIAPAKTLPGTPIEEVLRRNQATYEACPIFSAGFVEIRETLSDGRLVVEIRMDARYEIVRDLQEIPYRLVACRRFEDHVPSGTNEDSVDADRLRRELDRKFTELPGASGEALREIVGADDWRAQTTERYSYAIYDLILFDPDSLQRVLEMRSPAERIRYLLSSLHRVRPG